MYTYRRTEPGLWTVGNYTPDGEWMPESDHASSDAAAMRVHYLNGETHEERVVGYALSLAAMNELEQAVHRAGWIVARSKEEAEKEGLRFCHEVFPKSAGYCGWDCVALPVRVTFDNIPARDIM